MKFLYVCLPRGEPCENPDFNHGPNLKSRATNQYNMSGTFLPSWFLRDCRELHSPGPEIWPQPSSEGRQAVGSTALQDLRPFPGHHAWRRAAERRQQTGLRYGTMIIGPWRRRRCPAPVLSVSMMFFLQWPGRFTMADRLMRTPASLPAQSPWRGQASPPKGLMSSRSDLPASTAALPVWVPQALSPDSGSDVPMVLPGRPDVN